MLVYPKKGQIVELDLFIAIAIFGFILVITLLAWNTYSQKINTELNRNTDLIKAYHLSDLLTKYPGKPNSWETNVALGSENVLSIGLAKKDRIIDNAKLSTFLSLNYNQTKEIMNINIYEYYFKLSKMNGDFDSSLEKGTKITDKDTVVIRRYVIYNDTESIMEFWLQR